ncbi:MAG TPA: hypothetical protein VI564_07485, partial [Candidatus Nanoarchaeia archaeon]|nr:hypothetical protein [Candidatus Nanoarchaeia archaeon]
KHKNIIGKGTKIYGSVKNSSIGDNCGIYGKVKNSVIMDNTLISKNSIVENSVIGSNVKFDGITLSGKNTISEVNGIKIKIKNFGAVIADNSILENVAINPGCKVWPGMKKSGARISKDLK